MPCGSWGMAPLVRYRTYESELLPSLRWRCPICSGGIAVHLSSSLSLSCLTSKFSFDPQMPNTVYISSASNSPMDISSSGSLSPITIFSGSSSPITISSDSPSSIPISSDDDDDEGPSPAPSSNQVLAAYLCLSQPRHAFRNQRQGF